MPMKVLSIKPKYVEVILAGKKNEEIRNWPTSHRGVLLLHASKPVGAILGAVQVVDCLEDVYEGYAWQFERPVHFARPVPCKGKLGLWTLPDDLAAAVQAELAAR